MRKLIYIFMILVVVCFMFAGCVTGSTIEKLQDEIDGLEEEIKDYEDENKELEGKIEELELQKDALYEHNDELKEQTAIMKMQPDGEFSITYDEYFAQLIYLSLYWQMDMFAAPAVETLNDGTLRYIFPLYYGDSDTTLSNFELDLYVDPESQKLLSVVALIIQDEEYRHKGDAYLIGYQSITEVALSALILALYNPYSPDIITKDMLNGVINNNQEICEIYGITYEVSEEYEYEARAFFTFE